MKTLHDVTTECDVSDDNEQEKEDAKMMMMMITIFCVATAVATLEGGRYRVRIAAAVRDF